jgi:PAS domain S-box-containing protein
MMPKRADEVPLAPTNGYSLERFFALSLDMHVIAGADGYFKHASDSVTDVLGWSLAEMLSRPYLDFVHPDDHAATLAEADRQIRSGEKVLQFENRYRHKDGSWRLLSWKSMPADNLMYATARDITVRRRMQQELLDAKNAAEAANRELESFSYSVAHDLRAPLRGIDGFSQLLLEDYGETVGEEGRRYLRLVRESTRHMAQLIDDLLQLSRVTRSELKREVVDLTAVAHSVLSRLRAESPARQVDIRIEPGLTHSGDPRLLNIVLENLLGNAWKYSSKRDLAVIELGHTTQDGEDAYFVRDNGAGFDMKYLHKLFGVFERLHSVQEFEGTGIGLATVRRIVERHGGRAWAQGELDAGATFFFTLRPKEAAA